MIIEQHYDDEVLIGLLNEAEEDSHVPACDTCAGTLESYRDLSSALNDGAVWDEREVSESPSPKTTNFLRSFAERTRVEDAAARPIVAKLIADPALIEQHPEWRTAAVVRGVLAYVDSINYTDPKRAVDLSKFAAEVGDSIIATNYADGVVPKLRATAWREYGWALYFVGSFRESLDALDRAEECIKTAKLADVDRAEILLVRARAYRDMEKLRDAATLAQNSAKVFQAYGNQRRTAVAEAIQTSILMQLGRYAEALQIDLRMAADSALDAETRACAISRSAFSLRELGRFDEAKRRFAEAIAEFERLNLAEKRSMARWGLARVHLAEGKNVVAALAALQELKAEFTELGMAHDLALVSLDAAEAFIVLKRSAEVAELCREVIEYFRSAGLEYSAPAMTALSYLRETADANRLTRDAVRNVRTYFELLPKQPHLLFAFPL